MKFILFPIQLGLAAAITVSICYTVCTLIAITFPNMLLNAFNSMLLIVKIAPASFDANITLMRYVSGAFQVFVYIFIIHWLFALIYNYMLPKDI